MARVPEGERRVDRIREIVERSGGRMRVSELLEQLRGVEEDDELTTSSIYLAVRRENERREGLGEAPLFFTKREGEDWGFIRLQAGEAPGESPVTAQITEEVRNANSQLDEQLRARLQSMDWRTFESTFLQSVLEGLGFKDVEITQATRDGGVDARATYMRGIIRAHAIISAKHWSGKATVPATEVRHLRGIKGDEDTAIIVTTGRISADAKREAEPSQNQRVVYLIDGDELVEVCKRHQIGVKRVALPELLVIDESLFVGEDDEAPMSVAEPANARPIGMQRFRDEMLGDDGRGLTVQEIASLLDLAESTVRVYLSDAERRRSLGDRIRSDDEIRSRALALVAKRRSGTG